MTKWSSQFAGLWRRLNYIRQRRAYQRKILEAEVSLDELEKLSATEGVSSYATEEYYKEAIAFYETQRLIGQCKRYAIAVPSKEEEAETYTYWKKSEFFLQPQAPRSILSDTAFEELTAKVRKRKKEKLGTALSVVTALIGLVGAFTGLVAIWKD